MTTTLVITTYNRPEALELVLMSVAQQTCLPSEIIIADDGSTNETKKLTEEISSRMPIPILHRLGFTNTRNEARQLVRHGHFMVNGVKVNIPSFQVKPGDVIELREKSRKVTRIVEALDAAGRRGLPAFLDLDKDNFKGTVTSLPKREDIAQTINEQLIVEFYSR